MIFTESLETLKLLESYLPQDLRLRPNQVAVLRGTMRDSELMDTAEAFGQRDSPIRLLLCSDVAAEGINLHHLSHRMIHFDIPWSRMLFQQRNGRIDRYGQTLTPQIHYLMTRSEQPEVRGDQRILEMAYAGAALNWLKQCGVDLTFQFDAERRQVDFTAPDDLRQRLKFLPREARPKDDRFILSDRRNQIQDAIKAAREGEEFGNPLQFLWPLHPVMDWLQDRVLDGFGRHTAPIIRIPRRLSDDEHWFAGSLLSSSERMEVFRGFLAVCRWTEIYYPWRPNLPDEAETT